jgi:hypothetical protein
MSFAILSNTLDDCSAISNLNLTKNPFDSGTDGRLNLPAMSASPSIFLQTDTPGSQKVGNVLSLGSACVLNVSSNMYIVESMVICIVWFQ